MTQKLVHLYSIHGSTPLTMTLPFTVLNKQHSSCGSIEECHPERSRRVNRKRQNNN